MRHRLLLILVAFSLAAPVCAQESGNPSLPPGPLLKRAPDYSIWTVTYDGRPMEGKEPVKAPPAGEGGPKEKESATRSSTVVKTGSTILELNTDKQGKREELWHLSGLLVIKRPDATEPMVWPESPQNDIYSINFAVSDFAGLDWISAQTYAGMVKYQGRDCIQFKGEVSPLNPKAQEEEAIAIGQAITFGQPVPQATKVPATAYIDLETRLPLLVTFGKETRTYQYGPPPQTALVLPPALASAVQEREQQMKRLSAPAARAY